MDFQSGIDISVVVPTYRGAESLRELVARAQALFAERGLSGEIVLVNDASPDSTWSVIGELTRDHTGVVGVDLLTNHGQARATLCGIAYARGRFIATMDDDLQHWPEDLGVLYDALEAHPDWDAVVGTWPRDHPQLIKRFGSWLHGTVDRRIQGTPKGFRHSSFRMMRRPLADALVEHETRTPVLSPLVVQLSNQVHNVEVRHSERKHGTSTITFRESIDRVVTNIIHGTTLPLRILARLGAAAAFLSAVAAAGPARTLVRRNACHSRMGLRLPGDNLLRRDDAHRHRDDRPVPQRRPLARARIGDAHAVGRTAELNALRRSPGGSTARLSSNGPATLRARAAGSLPPAR